MKYYRNELFHHGIKGQKWGIRRYQNADGTLTDEGIKRYAIKGYAQDAYNRNKTKIGKAYDKYTGAHKIDGKMVYEANSSKKNKARAEKYLSDEKKKLTEEDLAEYKYSKAGESGWIGVGRAIKAKASEMTKSKTASELSSRGKSAIDVLMNGDTDWMGNKVSDESLTKEAKNRGKAALERMLYSQDQIDNKKFFGRYNF